MKNKVFISYISVVFLLIGGVSCNDEIDPPPPPPPPPIEFDTALTRYFSDLNTMGMYVGKTAPVAELEQMSNNKYQETLKRDSAILCAKKFYSKYIRLNIFKELWDDQTVDGGRQFFLDYYRASKEAGLIPVLNVNYHQSDYSTPEPFPDPTSYTNYLKEVLDSLNVIQWKPAVVVVENEEANISQYVIDTSDDTRMYADLQKYVDQLSAAITTGANYSWWDGSKGVEVTNGGLLTRNITFIVWDWFENTIEDEGLANYYAAKSFGPTLFKQIYKTPQPTFIEKRIKINKYLEAKYNALPMKYVNIHWTEPIAARGWSDVVEGGTPWSMGIPADSMAKGVFDLSVLYYHNTMPDKKLISNELSQLTYSAQLMQEFINKVKEHPYEAWDIVTFYNADGGNPYLTKGFHNTILVEGSSQVYTYTIRDNGIVLIENLKVLR